MKKKTYLNSGKTTTLVAIASLFTLPSLLSAANEIRWQPTAGAQFSTPGNWGGGSIPGASDIAVYDTAVAAASQEITITSNQAVAGIHISIVPDDTDLFSVSQTGGTVNIAATGGAVAGEGEGMLLLGVNSGNSGSYALTGGTLSFGGNGTVVNTVGTGNLAGTLVVGHAGGTGSFVLQDASGAPGSWQTNLTATGNILIGGNTGSGSFLHDGGKLSANALTVGDGRAVDVGNTPVSGTTGSYVMESGELTTTGRLTVGRFAEGTFEQKSGTVTATGGLYLGDNLDKDSGGTNIRGDGTYILRDGTLTAGNSEMGWRGKATFEQHGGTATFNSLRIGSQFHEGQRGEGTYSLHDGNLAVTSDLNIGTNTGNGTFNQSGGSVTVGGAFRLGQHMSTSAGTNVGAVAEYNMSGGTLTITGHAIIGEEGATGTFVQEGGSVIVNDQLRIGSWAAQIGGVNYGGEGEYILRDGSLEVKGNAVIGREGGKGTFTMEGGTFTHTGGFFTFGNNAGRGTGVGTFTQTGGTFSTSGIVELGRRGGTVDGQPATSTISISGVGTQATFTNQVNLGRDDGGRGIFTVADGATVNMSGELGVGWDGSGVGTLNVEGGTLTQTGATSVGRAGTAQGTINVSGGTLIAAGIEVGKVAGATGTINLTGGVLQANSITGGPGTSSLIIDGGTFRAGTTTSTSISGLDTFEIRSGGATFDVGSGKTITFNGLTGGTGKFTKQGEGSIFISGNNTAWTGALDVLEGVILTMNGASLGVTNVQVGSAGKSAGFYLLSGSTVDISGNLSVGSSGADKQAYLLLSGGTLNLTGGTVVGAQDTHGEVQQTAGVFNGQNVFLGASGVTGSSAVWKLSGTGQANIATLYLGAGSTGGTSTFYLGTASSGGTAGGTLTVDAITGGTNTSFIFDSGRLMANKDLNISGITNFNVAAGGGTIDTNGYTVYLSSGLNGTGDLTKQGTGKLVFNNDHSNWTGKLTVTGGNVEVTANATLLVSIANGQLANGFVFSDGSNVSLASGATLQIDLSGDTSGLRVGDTFAFFDGADVAISSPQDVSILSNNSNYTFTLESNGDLRLSGITPVPEPSTYALLGGAGLLGLIVLRRRRR